MKSKHKMKYCKNCKYFVPNTKPLVKLSDTVVDCYHPKNLKKDLVWGETVTINKPIDIRHSLSEEACGPDASWFEPKDII